MTVSLTKNFERCLPRALISMGLQLARVPYLRQSGSLLPRHGAGTLHGCSYASCCRDAHHLMEPGHPNASNEHEKKNERTAEEKEADKKKRQALFTEKKTDLHGVAKAMMEMSKEDIVNVFAVSVQRSSNKVISCCQALRPSCLL